MSKLCIGTKRRCVTTNYKDEVVERYWSKILFVDNEENIGIGDLISFPISNRHPAILYNNTAYTWADLFYGNHNSSMFGVFRDDCWVGKYDG